MHFVQKLHPNIMPYICKILMYPPKKYGIKETLTFKTTFWHNTSHTKKK